MPTKNNKQQQQQHQPLSAHQQQDMADFAAKVKGLGPSQLLSALTTNNTVFYQFKTSAAWQAVAGQHAEENFSFLNDVNNANTVASQRQVYEKYIATDVVNLPGGIVTALKTAYDSGTNAGLDFRQAVGSVIGTLAVDLGLTKAATSFAADVAKQVAPQLQVKRGTVVIGASRPAPKGGAFKNNNSNDNNNDNNNNSNNNNTTTTTAIPWTPAKPAARTRPAIVKPLSVQGAIEQAQIQRVSPLGKGNVFLLQGWDGSSLVVKFENTRNVSNFQARRLVQNFFTKLAVDNFPDSAELSDPERQQLAGLSDQLNQNVADDTIAIKMAPMPVGATLADLAKGPDRRYPNLKQILADKTVLMQLGKIAFIDRLVDNQDRFCGPAQDYYVNMENIAFTDPSQTDKPPEVVPLDNVEPFDRIAAGSFDAAPIATPLSRLEYATAVVQKLNDVCNLGLDAKGIQRAATLFAQGMNDAAQKCEAALKAVPQMWLNDNDTTGTVARVLSNRIAAVTVK